ncbi:trypsin-like serine peptidase [Kitasatospora sp. NPDC058965]|uniref:trypsin-like serine peptidase n=1 Tax=Kitasatospora sp. NPDC058965 TaxID=3346682 RepID=UPI0036B77AF7
MTYRISRRAGLTTVVVAALALGAAACGPDETGSTDTASAAASAKPGLPAGLQDLKKWKATDWANWAKQHVLKNQIVKDLWTVDAMNRATPAEAMKPTDKLGTDTGQNDPLPGPVQAKGEKHPYTGNMAVFGKLFMKSPKGTYVCSGTVVSDPAHPGKSNLVWTAGHCLHGGKDGDWLQNIAFVPDYNRTGAASGGKQVTLDQVAPFGRWWADYAMVAPQWVAEGGETGGPVSQYDSGIIQVANPDMPGKSLEETVGGSVPVWFNAPRNQVHAITAYGYPSARPFDGQELEYCDGGAPSKLSFDADRPTMLTIGCTMTAGSSGGGWLTRDPSGKVVLVSNTSIGPNPSAWLAGPELDDQAQGMFQQMTTLPQP